MMLHDVVVAITLGLLCGVDGCVLAACAVGASMRLRPLTLGLVAFTGHLFVGTLGVLGNSIADLGGRGFAEWLTVAALFYLAYRVLKPHDFHVHLERISLVALAVVLSIDAVPAGVALYGETLHSAAKAGQLHEQTRMASIVAASLLNGISAVTVGCVTVIAALLFTRLSEFSAFTRLAPAVAAAMIVFLWVRSVWLAAAASFGPSLESSLAIVPLATSTATALAAFAWMWFRNPPAHDCSHDSAIPESGELHRDCEHTHTPPSDPEHS